MAEEGLFGECYMAFVPSNSLTPKHISDMSVIVEKQGATVLDPRRDGTLALEKVTHLISNTIDFQQYDESQSMMIPVVTMGWISASVARNKLAQPRPFSPDPRMIFSQVVVSCADLPITDKESIIGATMAMGGQETKDVNKLTTHICALSMDSQRVQIAKSKGWKGKVVLPHWFDDCFRLGKRIDETPYVLPDPEILRKSADDALDIPDSTNLDGATSANPKWLPLPPDSEVARAPATVFEHHKILLSDDLNITPRLAAVVQDIIINGGGRLVRDVENCDMYIGQYRDGSDYVKAAQAGRDVGNLAWLFYLIVHNEWTSPLRRLLHYPVPRNGIDGFKGLKITVSNYGGEARIYLENLIKACGAEFTKTMKADNTHLITARDSSEKCKAAPEWGVAVINHLWIEESYAKCEIKPMTIKKYTHFPPRTNLGEIIGQTFLDESTLRSVFYPGEPSPPPQAKKKRKVLEAAVDKTNQNTAPEDEKEEEPAQAVSPVSDEDVTMVHDENEAKKPARKPKTYETPIRPKKAKEEPTSVISTGGRSAKAKARDLLQNIAPDIELYEKEKKRHGKSAAPWGGKRAADQVEKERAAKQEKETAKEQDVEDDEDEGSKRSAKRSRVSLPDVETRVVLTGFTRWVGDVSKEGQDRKKLRELGILIVQEGSPCDYLAAPHIVRTVKFLCALARGPQVISSTFIDKILETSKVPDVEKFLLKDKEAESKYNFKLVTSVARAKANRGKLLQGVPVYCAESIRNGSDSYRAIAEANGAIFKIYRARSGTTIKPTTAEEDGHAPPEPVYLLSGASPEERKLWPKFEDMATKGNMEPRIVTPDWLLDVAMAQQVRFDEKFLSAAQE